MFEKTYRSMLRQVPPGEDLILSTSAAMEQAADAPAGKQAKRPFALALACALAAVLSLTAAAAAFPGFRELLFGPHSQLAGSLTPIAEGCEAGGIRMEVLGTMAEEDSFSVYFTLQDLEKRDRLSGDASVIERVRLDGRFPYEENVVPAGTSSFTHVLDYDAGAQTVLCRMDMTTDYRALENAQVRLAVIKVDRPTETVEYAPLELAEELLSGETLPIHGLFTYDSSSDVPGAPTGIKTLEELAKEDPGIDSPQESASPWDDWFRYSRDSNGGPAVLKPEDGVAIPGIGFSRVTAAGFLDGKLHIQTIEQPWVQAGSYEHYSLYCADRGEGREMAGRLAARRPGPGSSDSYDMLSYKNLGIRSFSLDEQGRGAISGHRDDAPYYFEYVFDIGPEELDQYEFFACASSGTILETDLAVEFTLAGSLPQGLASYGPLEAGDTAIDTLEITPMGVFITGTRGGIGGIESLELVCGDKAVPYRLAETSRSYYNLWPQWDEDDYASAKYLTDGAAVDPEQVTALRINGMEVPLA